MTQNADYVRFPLPAELPEPLDYCWGCDWDTDVVEHNHADYAQHFATFDEWEAHPSKSLYGAMSTKAGNAAGCSDWDGEAYLQEEAEQYIEAMQRDGWRFIRVEPDQAQIDSSGAES